MKYLFHSHADIYKALKTKDYQKAVYKQFALAQKVHPTFRMTGWFKDKELRLLPGATFVETGKYEPDWGTTYRGKSVETVRAEYKHPYMSLLQFLRFITENPKAYIKWLEDSKKPGALWGLDFPGDQLRCGGEFSLSPRVLQDDAGSLLGSYWASGAGGCCGSSLFCWESTGTSNVETSVLPEPLDFDLEVVRINGVLYKRVEE